MSFNKKSSTHFTYNPNSIDTNTTFVQANPSNFRAVVQRLTGAPSTTTGSNPSLDSGFECNRAPFKLHERRMRKLEMIKLNKNYYKVNEVNGPIRGCNRSDMVSPISTLDGLGLELGSPSPSPRPGPSNVVNEEKERAIIAEKGFYLHTNPTSTIRRNYYNEPQLLPLFPLHSPRD